MMQASATYEGIADSIVQRLHVDGALAASGGAPWDAFLRLSDLVHAAFSVPGTTITPMMRRLLFAIGIAARPRQLVAVGSYVGYAIAWLLRDRSDASCSPFVERAYAIDVDAVANRIAERNCAALGHGPRLHVVCADAVAGVAMVESAIDLLFLDLDDPVTGKARYADVLLGARARLAPGAMVLAHDPCVGRFAADFNAYHRVVNEEPWLTGPWILPVDGCGLSVAVAVEEPA